MWKNRVNSPVKERFLDHWVISILIRIYSPDNKITPLVMVCQNSCVRFALPLGITLDQTCIPFNLSAFLVAKLIYNVLSYHLIILLFFNLLTGQFLSQKYLGLVLLQNCSCLLFIPCFLSVFFFFCFSSFFFLSL